MSDAVLGLCSSMPNNKIVHVIKGFFMHLTVMVNISSTFPDIINEYKNSTNFAIVFGYTCICTIIINYTNF